MSQIVAPRLKGALDAPMTTTDFGSKKRFMKYLPEIEFCAA
jgi:hypothetical protein